MSLLSSVEGGDFVGRRELLVFINSTLELQLDRIEDTASGCVACQLLDIIYPNVVPMNKISWSANKNFESIANYRILQTCFKKLNIDRHIVVDRLISGKHLDNLEFMQWLKRLYESTGATKGDYDCFAERRKGKGGEAMNSNSSSSLLYPASPMSTMKSSFSFVSRPNTSMPKSSLTSPSAISSQKKQMTRPINSGVTILPFPYQNQEILSSTPVKISDDDSIKNQRTSDSGLGADHATAYTTAKMRMIMKENEQLRKFKKEALKAITAHVEEVDSLEMERDFYFDKLREIEIIIQHMEDNDEATPLSTSVLHIIYETPDGLS